MDEEQTIHLDFNGSTGMTIIKFKLEGQVDYELYNSSVVMAGTMSLATPMRLILILKL